MSFHPTDIEPDVALQQFLDGLVDVGLAEGGTTKVKVYSDWERPTNELPTDFITVYINGDVNGLGLKADYGKGNIMLSLYCKMNDDGSVKKNRIKKILHQIDDKVEKKVIGDYFFEYDKPRFITPTTPNQSSGYSITTLNLKWHTTESFNKSNTTT